MERNTKLILGLGWVLLIAGAVLALAMFSVLQEHKSLGDPNTYPDNFQVMRTYLIEKYGKLPGLEDLATHPDPHARWRQYIAHSCMRGFALLLIGIGLVSRRPWGRYLVLTVTLVAVATTCLEVVKLNANGISLTQLLLNRFGGLSSAILLFSWYYFPSNRTYFHVVSAGSK